MKLAMWPRSLQGQMLLAVALALLLAQGISTALLYRVGTERRREALIHNAAFRLLTAMRQPIQPLPPAPENLSSPRAPGKAARGIRPERAARFAAIPGDRRLPDAERELGRIFAEQEMPASTIIVLDRPVSADPVARARVAHRASAFAHPPESVLLAAVQREQQGDWLVARVLVPPSSAGLRFLATLIAQTLVIYAVLVGAIAFLLRRITRPLAKLTGRLERFAVTRNPDGQIQPEGPEDIRRLILAQNAMEARIAALLDEKDVMLGAIGHDLKTPLAALRVRIESVDNEIERKRMAATIEDIVRSLDDILSLARVGRPHEPLEATEMSALVASVVEEYEDMGAPVIFGAYERIVAPLRATWLRRALRNLIDNAARYGGAARVSLARVGDAAFIRIDDDGPGIPESDIVRMLEPFVRGDPSRNSETGGAGLGLALARAIADQHGGTLTLANRKAGDGRIAGLSAVLRLPLT